MARAGRISGVSDRVRKTGSPGRNGTPKTHPNPFRGVPGQLFAQELPVAFERVGHGARDVLTALCKRFGACDRTLPVRRCQPRQPGLARADLDAGRRPGRRRGPLRAPDLTEVGMAQRVLVAGRAGTYGARACRSLAGARPALAFLNISTTELALVGRDDPLPPGDPTDRAARFAALGPQGRPPLIAAPRKWQNTGEHVHPDATPPAHPAPRQTQPIDR